MGFQGNVIVLLFGSLCIYLTFTLVKVLYKLWWTPIRMQNFMASQGIRGPSYRFVHGSTKEVMAMKKEAMAKPMTLSHNIFPKGMIPEMIAGVEMMLERWKQNEGREIEVYDELRLLTSEIISRTAFGSSYLEGKNIFDMLTKLSLIINTYLYKLRLPGISKFWRTRDEIESENLVKGIRNSMMEIIKKREEKVKTGEAEGEHDYQ
ncbi:hypothetical protein DKX38_015867 [Salix brachista]|uniref:Cytochrome P450 n=1 Tax=Salix brachista TaxID=2182728 RepID=A0A5N5L6F2_9ROSI|nr:hypothetical protein DKX38_015867 [Salix brachista]